MWISYNTGRYRKDVCVCLLCKIKILVFSSWYLVQLKFSSCNISGKVDVDL